MPHLSNKPGENGERSTADRTRFDSRLAFHSSRLLRLAVGLALVYALLVFIGSTKVPPVAVVTTTATLPGSIAESWAVLTDFPAYAEWNPYLPEIDGEFAVGETITLTLVADEGATPIRPRARIEAISPQREFSWQGVLPIPGLFATRHVFALEPIDDSHTRLHHYEEFRGLAVALLPFDRAVQSQRIARSFERMNNALVERLLTRP
ncbi:MAG: hypothetical protein Hals2KO_38520 [Halioglobus sp.]